MQHTQIEWAKSPDGSQGFTFNPITGCLNGCPYCYARRLANTRLKERYLANSNLASPVIVPADIKWHGPSPAKYEAYRDPFYPRFWPERLKEIVRRSQGRNGIQRRGIFTCDMADPFGIGVPEDWTRRIIAAIRNDPLDRFYLLTKQAQNLPNFCPFPPNCWVGVSVTDQIQLSEALRGLLATDARIKFLSCEPLLGELNVSFFQGEINWVIIGAMTCGGADLARLSALYPQLTPTPYQKRYVLLPQEEWVAEIVAAAEKAGAAVFIKNNLLPLFESQGITTREDWTGLRQEMPGGTQNA